MILILVVRRSPSTSSIPLRPTLRLMLGRSPVAHHLRPLWNCPPSLTVRRELTVWRSQPPIRQALTRPRRPIISQSTQLHKQVSGFRFCANHEPLHSVLYTISSHTNKKTNEPDISIFHSPLARFSISGTKEHYIRQIDSLNFLLVVSNTHHNTNILSSDSSVSQ